MPCHTYSVNTASVTQTLRAVFEEVHFFVLRGGVHRERRVDEFVQRLGLSRVAQDARQLLLAQLSQVGQAVYLWGSGFRG